MTVLTGPRLRALWLGALFFAGTYLFLELVALIVPGRPLIVGTPSIPVGLYWRFPGTLPAAGAYFSFRVNPVNQELRRRYVAHEGMAFTKIALGVPGDRVVAQGKVLSVCTGKSCRFAGEVQSVDSKGRPLQSWLRQQGLSGYTLKEDEFWAFGPYWGSLDSRYLGPIKSADITGAAVPVWQMENTLPSRKP